MSEIQAVIPRGVADFVRTVASDHGGEAASHTVVSELAHQGQRRPQPDRARARLYACAGVVVKIHPFGADTALLRRRLQVITQPGASRFWVQPLHGIPILAPDGRLTTIWPRVAVLAPDHRPPWTQLGTLLAELHRTRPAGSSFPQAGVLARLGRAIDYLRRRPYDDLIWLVELGENLASRLRRPQRTAMIHGDLHLGQLGRPSPAGDWYLLDPDDTGVGDPAWDLARPAAFWAAGLLPDEPWTILLNAYRAAGGPAVPPAGDPWTDLDPPARAATLIAAARSLRSGESPATTRALLQACRRMQDS